LWRPAFVLEGVPVVFSDAIHPGWALLASERGGRKRRCIPSGYPPAQVSRHHPTDLQTGKRPLTSLWKGRRGMGGPGVVVVDIQAKYLENMFIGNLSQ
jgi:hypothetical protein